MSRIFLGVDPGCNGAIASLTSAGAILEISRFSEAETHGQEDPGCCQA
jgi:predicted RNase H-like nuclease (RuvC/YqgF family)